MVRDLISNLKQSDSSVLLTGHTGFKGTWMTLLLERLGIEVFGYSLQPTESSLYNRLGRVGKIVEVFDDIRNQDKLNSFFSSVKPKYVIHMAAQPLVRVSYEQPIETFEINVMGTINVINASILTGGVDTIGIVTTDKVYQNNNLGRRFTESDPLQGLDPYSASKVAAESVVKSWINIQKVKGGPQLVSLRAGTVIGGGDLAHDRIIPDLVRGVISNSLVEIRNPLSTRPWQHVLDPLFGYLLGISKVSSGFPIKENAINFGPTEPSYSVEQLIDIIEKNFPGVVKYKFRDFEENDVKESVFLDLDSELARNTLGWTPVWSQEQAIIATFKWWQVITNKKLSAQLSIEKDIEKLIEFYGLKGI
jgi:CDP-glucose 4,6-dehydratase